MTKTAKTLREMRDHILKKMNALGSSDYEDVVITYLNDAVADISAMHDWEFLRKKSTLTFGSATPKASLPTDCDRVLAIHKSGNDYMLSKIEPLKLEMAKEDSSITAPMFWCVQGYDQTVATQAPYMNIEVHAEPSNGDEYTIWYIKLLDEMIGDSTDLDEVPNIPYHMWTMVGAKAVYEGMMLIEAPSVNIQHAERHFVNLLEQAKKREKYGSTHYSSFSVRGDVAAHYATRFR